ncbi:DUF1697 domain-containing protein [Microbacterium sp. CFBP9034]|uniref:DUF1697 domain-containing protein n=1 Tax=Microbacterium sp. CFBP9034 TaxID=3096540 RepID=UPI002A6A3733|nr:DUF1697 domain-containing protein [Microbacterium sp. CFBP9034]MDY0909750.1 DUF1697 domain-containing protein [Microbacterium sp. CFBP9034]
MTAWVALLRGVNVGGITIRSADLAELFTGLGFAAVRTVLASGNVVFEAEAAASARAKLKARIEQALRDRFGYDAWIVLVTADELAAAADAFPFDETDAARQPWVVFCVDSATRDELTTAAEGMDADADPVAAGPGVVYWSPVKGTTVDTPFGKLLGKTTYKPRTTNRNLRTLRKILG